MDYNIIYSKRKTAALHITKDGKVEIRCNRFIPKSAIKKFIDEKNDWIEKKQTEINTAKLSKIQLTDKLVADLTAKANKVIPERVEYYSNIMEVAPNNIKINTARTRWGSCSGKNNLNFSCRLMLANDETINYVVIHELAHIKQHNHNKEFWNIVNNYCPDHKKRKQDLKQLNLRIEN